MTTVFYISYKSIGIHIRRHCEALGIVERKRGARGSAGVMKDVLALSAEEKAS